MSEFYFCFVLPFFSIETYYDRQLNSTGVLPSLYFHELKYFLFYTIISFYIIWKYVTSPSVNYNRLHFLPLSQYYLFFFLIRTLSLTSLSLKHRCQNTWFLNIPFMSKNWFFAWVTIYRQGTMVIIKIFINYTIYKLIMYTKKVEIWRSISKIRAESDLFIIHSFILHYLYLISLLLASYLVTNGI